MELGERSFFTDLPEALVEEMLSNYKILSNRLYKSFEETQRSREKIRNSLEECGLIKRDSEVTTLSVYPTTCGIDGAYTIERLLSTDIVAVAGVAVEGLTPPNEKRLWPQPHHLCKVLVSRHHDETRVVIGAIMHAMELELAFNAPHDVVFLDGSLTTPIIRFNQALNILSDIPETLSQILWDIIEDAIKSYKEILLAARSDKIYVGIPKYTTKNEISSRIRLEHEDRSLLTFVLNSGELVGPVQMELPKGWHINIHNWPNTSATKANELIQLLSQLSVIYYRPYEYLPTFRLELPPSITSNKNRLSVILNALKLQCSVTKMMEPYPLYLADRMVKHLSTAVPAIRKAVTQEMASTAEDIGNIFLAMHGYRTEYGR